MRHVLGEALSVGAVLNWGPGYYHQRQYFEAPATTALSTASTLLRYDLEVSGFPSSHCGHLVLLRLRDQDYPDTRQIEDWPSWDLPILQWAKAQGAVAGFAHTGWGLQVKSRELPNYEMPPFDGIGANEYIVDVDARRGRLHLGVRHAVRARAEHLVPHAQLRLPDAESAARPTFPASPTSGSAAADRTCRSTGALTYDALVRGRARTAARTCRTAAAT